jgi:hypothetical protein
MLYRGEHDLARKRAQMLGRLFQAHDGRPGGAADRRMQPSYLWIVMLPPPRAVVGSALTGAPSLLS